MKFNHAPAPMKSSAIEAFIKLISKHQDNTYCASILEHTRNNQDDLMLSMHSNMMDILEKAPQMYDTHFISFVKIIENFFLGYDENSICPFSGYLSEGIRKKIQDCINDQQEYEKKHQHHLRIDIRLMHAGASKTCIDSIMSRSPSQDQGTMDKIKSHSKLDIESSLHHDSKRTIGANIETSTKTCISLQKQSSLNDLQIQANIHALIDQWFEQTVDPSPIASSEKLNFILALQDIKFHSHSIDFPQATDLLLNEFIDELDTTVKLEDKSIQILNKLTKHYPHLLFNRVLTRCIMNKITSDELIDLVLDRTSERQKLIHEIKKYFFLNASHDMERTISNEDFFRLFSPFSQHTYLNDIHTEIMHLIGNPSDHEPHDANAWLQNIGKKLAGKLDYLAINTENMACIQNMLTHASLTSWSKSQVKKIMTLSQMAQPIEALLVTTSPTRQALLKTRLQEDPFEMVAFNATQFKMLIERFEDSDLVINLIKKTLANSTEDEKNRMNQWLKNIVAHLEHNPIQQRLIDLINSPSFTFIMRFAPNEDGLILDDLDHLPYTFQNIKACVQDLKYKQTCCAPIKILLMNQILKLTDEPITNTKDLMLSLILSLPFAKQAQWLNQQMTYMKQKDQHNTYAIALMKSILNDPQLATCKASWARQSLLHENWPLALDFNLIEIPYFLSLCLDQKDLSYFKQINKHSSTQSWENAGQCQHLCEKIIAIRNVNTQHGNILIHTLLDESSSNILDPLQLTQIINPLFDVLDVASKHRRLSLHTQQLQVKNQNTTQNHFLFYLNPNSIVTYLPETFHHCYVQGLINLNHVANISLLPIDHIISIQLKTIAHGSNTQSLDDIFRLITNHPELKKAACNQIEVICKKTQEVITQHLEYYHLQKTYFSKVFNQLIACADANKRMIVDRTWYNTSMAAHKYAQTKYDEQELSLRTHCIGIMTLCYIYCLMIALSITWPYQDIICTIGSLASTLYLAYASKGNLLKCPLTLFHLIAIAIIALSHMIYPIPYLGVISFLFMGACLVAGCIYEQTRRVDNETDIVLGHASSLPTPAKEIQQAISAPSPQNESGKTASFNRAARSRRSIIARQQAGETMTPICLDYDENQISKDESTQMPNLNHDDLILNFEDDQSLGGI